MPPVLTSTNFNFHASQNIYRGKVRDVYTIGNMLVMIATDRISAFDVVLPRGIPHKGMILNSIAGKFLNASKELVPSWFVAIPDPNVTIGKMCQPLRVEMVIRGYLCGHAWREYKAGKRILCGVSMPEGMAENDRFPEPIITPSTKATEGHDEDISKEKILEKGMVSPQDYAMMERYTYELFSLGTKIAAEKGLLLADTKYEFGKSNGDVLLIDEIHTPDSSRYFYADGYEDRQKQHVSQKQLSKEFVREWLMDNGFQGKENQKVPDMTDDVVNGISARYTELFEKITGDRFIPPADENPEIRIERNVKEWLRTNLGFDL